MEFQPNMSFSDLGLSAELLKAIAHQGYTIPTPVQRQAIPLVLQGRDVLVGAQTGTGKTAGFTLPLLQLLQELRPLDTAHERSERASLSELQQNQLQDDRRPSSTSRPILRSATRKSQQTVQSKRPVRALILTPTRELASQVSESVRAYGQFLSLKSTVIFGGVSIRPQISALRRGVDIVVATPGRLLDHLSQRTLDLSQVEILVLDEADRMLDMGFVHDIRKIVRVVPRDRQTLLFSATFSREIRALAQDFLDHPQEVQIARHSTAAESVDQRVVFVDQKCKRELLSFMIGSQNWQQVLVFTRTKHRANRLTEQLNKDGLKSAAIHGNKSQNARTKALSQFKDGTVRVLVATDIAARGLDIQQLPHVVNYELPHVPEDYVHRIGRTGRAGNEGSAISLVCGEEKTLLRDIERLLKRKIDEELWEGYEPTPQSRRQPSSDDALEERRGRSPGRSGSASRGAKGRRSPNSRSSSPAAKRSSNGSSSKKRSSSRASTGNSSERGHSVEKGHRQGSDWSSSDLDSTPSGSRQPRVDRSRPVKAKSSNRSNSERPNSERANISRLNSSNRSKPSRAKVGRNKH